MTEEQCKKNNQCQSCLFLFSKDPQPRENEKYCNYCYKNGKFLYEGNDLKEFQKIAYKGMRSKGINPIKATFFTWLIRFAPRWQK